MCWESLVTAPCFLLLHHFVLFDRFSHLGSGRDFDRLGNAVSSRRVDLLAGLGNLCEDGVVRKSGDDSSGLLLKRDIVALNACIASIHVSQSDTASRCCAWRCRAGRGCWRSRTVKLLEDTVDGAGAAAASHGDVELVRVARHDVLLCMCCLFVVGKQGDVVWCGNLR